MVFPSETVKTNNTENVTSFAKEVINRNSINIVHLALQSSHNALTLYVCY